MADSKSDAKSADKTNDTANDSSSEVTRSERSAVSGLMVLLLSLVVAFGAYFFLHVRQREMEISEHQLRLLQGAGESVSDALSGLRISVANAFLLTRADLPSSTRGTANPYKQAVQNKLGLIDGIVPASSDYNPDSLARWIRPEVDRKGDIRSDLRLILDVETGVPRLILVGRRKNSEAPADTLTLTSQITLQTLLVQTLPTATFDGVLLTRANGDVLLQQGTSEVRIRHIEPPPPKMDKDSKLPLTATATGSRVYDLPIASQKYKVFVQRIPLPVGIYSRDSAAPWRCDQDWQVVGFMSASRFSGATMQISPAIVLVAICFVVFGLLSLPILKVRFLGPREELRHIDVIILAFSVLVCSALATFALGYYAMHESIADNTENQLDSLSVQIRNHLHEELARLDRTLVILTDHRKSDSTKAALRGSLLSDSALVAAIRDGDSLGRLTPFEQGFWVKGTGQQSAKWNIRETPTALVSVKSRTYYRLATQDMVLPSGRASTWLLPGYSVESIRSLTTGRESAVLARRMRPLSADTLAGIEARLQSVIGPVIPPNFGFAVVNRGGDVQFHSDHVRNLRENFFRELEASAALREAVEARQSTVARTEYRTVPSVLHVAPIDGTPWSLITFVDARPSRMWLVSTLTTAIGLYAAYVIVMMLFGWSTRWLHDPARPGEPRRLWFWPQNEHGRRYRDIARALAVAVVVSVAVIFMSGSVIALLFSMAVPLILIGRIILTTHPLGESPHSANDVNVEDAPLPAGRRGWRAVKARMSRPSELYRVTLVLSVLVVGVIPAVGTLRAISLEAERLRLCQDQLAYANALRTRQRDQRAWFREVPAAPSARAALEDDVFGRTSDLDALGFNTLPGWKWSFADTAETDSLRGALTRGEVSSPLLFALQSFLGRHGAPSMWTASGPADDSKPVWARDRAGRVVGLFRETFTRGDVTSTATWDSAFRVLRIEAAPTAFRLRAGYFVWIILLGSVALIALIAVIRMVYRWVALGDMEHIRVLNGRNALKETPNEEPPRIPGLHRALLIRFALQKDVRKRWSRIDSHEVRQAETMKTLVGRIPWDAEGVVLERFDHGLKETDMVQRKLELLEALEFERPSVPVVIETQVEPLGFLVARFQDHFEERHELGIDVVRWTSVLEPYVRYRIPLEDGADPGASTKANTDGVQPQAEPWPKALTLETDCDEGLKEYGSRLMGLAGIRGLNRRQMVMTVLDMALPYYQRVWSCCSTEEKLLLYRVAKEGVVNHRAIRTLRPLLRRGLIRMDPNPRIMNESFRLFVLDAERPEVFAKWQARGGLSPWARMRTPIVLSISVLGTFFFATQREVLDQSLALMATLAAGAPGVLSLLSGVGQLRQGNAKK